MDGPQTSPMNHAEVPMDRVPIILDGNEAAASVAYRLSEVIAIYPITPYSPMGAWADKWRSEGKKNIWGAVPDVVEMQSDGGALDGLRDAGFQFRPRGARFSVDRSCRDARIEDSFPALFRRLPHLPRSQQDHSAAR